MSIDSTWLRCPNCFADLEPVDDRTLGCSSGHRFDVGKHGAVTLLPPRAPRTIGDSREMLEARHALLDSGVFRPIADGIVRASRIGAPGAHSDVRVVDLGCGTGYYSSRLAEDVPTGAFLLADRSPIAVRMAMRLVPGSTGVVLDLWRPLPVRESAADLAINVFAPRNPAEFARIIRPGGALVVVVPTGAHLQELRSEGGMLDIPRGKDAQVTDQLGPAGFVPEGAERLEYLAEVDASQRGALVEMGPSAHHTHVLDSDHDRPDQDLDRVTVSVDILTFRR